MYPIEYVVIVRKRTNPDGSPFKHELDHELVFRMDHIEPEDQNNPCLFFSSDGWTLDTLPDAICDFPTKIIGGPDFFCATERTVRRWRTIINTVMLEYHEYYDHIRTKRSRFEMLEIV